MLKIDGTRFPTVSSSSILGFFGPYRFLSNYHLSPVPLDGLVYPSGEHAYVAQKALGFKLRAYICTLPTPQDARMFGQGLTLPCNWMTHRIPAMRRVVLAKLENALVKDSLVNTGTKYLEETNDWGDQFWGVANDIGENQLGKLWMELRA